MAVTYRSATSAAQITGTTAAPSKPTGLTTGDLMVAIQVSDKGGDLASMTAPSGWTLLGSQEGDTTNCHVKVWSKVATGTDAAASTFAFPDSTGADCAVGLLAITNGTFDQNQTITPVFTVNNTAAAAMVAPAVTGTNGGLLICGYAAETDGTARTFTPPSGMTERVDVTPASSPWVALEVATLALTSSGSTGTKTATCSGAEPSVTVSLVIDPPPAAAGAATFDAAGSLAATATRIQPAAATLTAAGSMVAAGEVRSPVTMSAAGSMTASAYVNRRAAATFTAAGSMTVAAARVQRIAATFTAAGQLTATGTRVHVPAVAPMTAAGSMASAGTRVHTPKATFTASGSLTASAAVRPGQALIVALWAVDRATGALVPLPHYTDLTLSREANAPGAISVEYPTTGKNWAVLRDGVTDKRDLEVEIWLGGRQSSALRGLLMQASGDDAAEGGTWTFAGHFLEWRLGEVLVYPQDANPKKELTFASANAGTIVKTLLDQAQARGALTDITRDWTTTADSSGQAWPLVVAGLTFAPKTTYLQILAKLVELGLIEWEITAAKVLRVWAAERRGVDRTAGATARVTFRRGQNLAEAPRRSSVRDSGTATLVTGADGVYATASDATALANRGRRVEVAANAGNIAQQAALNTFNARYLAVATKGQHEQTHGLTFAAGHPIPARDFNVGDWCWSETRGTLEKQRVSQWTLTVDANGASGTVSLGDLILDRLTAIYRRLSEVQSGGAVVGTSDPPPGADGMPPAAPTGVVVNSIADDSDGYGFSSATLIVGWDAVTTNADGTPARDVAGYRVQWRPESAGADGWRLGVDDGVPLGSGGGPLPDNAQAAQLILDRIESGLPINEDWTWSGAPLVVSAQNDTLLAAFEADHPGADTLGDTARSWFDVYIFENTPVGGGGGGGGGSTTTTSVSFGGVDAGVPVRVRVSAYDNSGNVSAWSTEVGVTTETDTTPPPTPSTPTVTPYLGQLKVAWNGLGSAGQPMPIDLERVDLHVSTANNFTPTATTLKDNFSTIAGERVITDLPYGVGQFVRLVAVDRQGNASAPSGTASAVPEKVVSDDVFDGAIGSAKLADLAVITAKIDNLAVNDAKFGSASVGKLTAGTLTASVTNSGILRSGTTGQRYELDAAALRLYNTAGTQTVQLNGTTNWISGELRSALSGARISINPGGSLPDTIRFYDTGGSSFSEITTTTVSGQSRINIRSSTTRSDGQRAELSAWPNEAAMTWGNLTGKVTSRIWVDINTCWIYAPTVNLSADRRSAVDAFGYRVSLFHTGTNGDLIDNSLIEVRTKVGDEAWIVAPNRDVGIVFGSNEIFISNGPGNSVAKLTCSVLTQQSSESTKTEIRDLAIDPLAAVRSARPKQWRQAPPDPSTPKQRYGRTRHIDSNGRAIGPVEELVPPEPAEQPLQYGPTAEELVVVAPGCVETYPDRPEQPPGIRLGSYIGLVHAALIQGLAEYDARLDEVATRLDAIDRRPPR